MAAALANDGSDAAVPRATFECPICFNEAVPISKRLVCAVCRAAVCLPCQYAYKKDDCMRCRAVFKHAYLPKAFIIKIVKPNCIAELKLEQTAKLPQYAEMVEYEKEYRKQMALGRFGTAVAMQPRPSLKTFTGGDNTYPCIRDQCHGYVRDNECFICKTKYCIKCREILKGAAAEHICKMTDILAIAEIKQHCKPCPKCYTQINKDMGCDHMHCTNCNTHYSWSTLTIWPSMHGINQHNIALAGFATRYGGRRLDGSRCGEVSLDGDRVAIENIAHAGDIPADIMQILYHDSSTIRYLKRKMYNHPVINLTAEDNYNNVAVKYLLNELTEQQWGDRLYSIFRQTRLKLLYSDVLTIYLELIDAFQTNIADNNFNWHDMRVELHKMIQLCNDSFASIFEEYGGGNLHHIRNIDDDPKMPAIIT